MSKYYLLLKNKGQKFVQYNGSALRLVRTKTPYLVDEVVLGKYGDENFRCSITTFRDSKGQPIEKAFAYSDKPFKNRG